MGASVPGGDPPQVAGGEALNVSDKSDFSSYVSPRTLWSMRDIVGRLGLEESIFENVIDALKKLFDLDPSKQRLDSVHIFSNMAHLGRIRLFVRTIRKFLVNLKRHHADRYEKLGDVAIRYEEKNDGRFAVKPSESSRTLQEVGNDCFLLVERFKDQDTVVSMSSYQLLVRLLNEQCVLEKNAAATQVIIKSNKEVPSDSLQNPSDPDAAGYCGHKEKTDAFCEAYRFRAGVEATMSDLDRITRLKHLRVRGMPQVRVSAVLKATGLNILRATTFRNRSRRPKKGNEGSNPSQNDLAGVVKEQILQLLDSLRELSGTFCPGNDQNAGFRSQGV